MRIVGVNIPDTKRAEIALTYIYGIGRSAAVKILQQANVDLYKRASQFTPDEVSRIKGVIEKSLKIEGELRRERSQNIRRLIDIKAYRGLRHMRRLPVRGQRTRTNSRTVRGNVRKTVGSGKRKVELK
ncbi:MAG: 30S ribosomal protein S13 [Parcubacteria group bacterium RIFCSPLOWO2_01_FULL_48_18]|nr:MAG: 30S ribosomal protein S13 [Parcubacteria group bacterium RIFCSPLOWO2_01_FULL_48_18]OHB24053.1 MAG: 30S ribosomal protein S13 [Parcubacteria group bacterium RIFCSPHIGHO2_02_FULL_48_10b]